ncbi:ubiquinol-cytochrome c reductase cytochrome c1 subunit [Burkholderiales bacterium]|nr:ubiquinol-cytochrome c reductase cytochrome c1 subunit [Burkholderiales bacterium]
MDMKTVRSPRAAAAILAAAAVLAASGPAAAAGGPDLRFERAPVHRLDDASLQRGARNFVNYCLNCHSAKYMRFNRLTDIGLTEDQIRDNLILGDAKLGDVMNVAMRPADAKAWFGVPPPDLSVESRVRGRDWLYNYFLGFYRDPASATGWNNLVFPNVGMPHVLWTLSGTTRLVTAEFADHQSAVGAAIASKGLALVEPIPGGRFAVRTVAADVPGSMTPVEYRGFVADLVNYMEYMGEPVRNKRINLGIVVLMFLGVLFFFAYWLKREYWKDVH